MKLYRSDQWIGHEMTIHIFSSSASTEMELHTHDFIEIIYITDGKAVQTINSISYPVKRGDLLFLNYGSTHSFLPTDRVSYLNICFAPEVLTTGVVTPENVFSFLQLTAFEEIQQESNDGVISFHGSEREEIEQLLSMMQKEYKERKPSWKTVVESYMNILLIRVLRKLTMVELPQDRADLQMWEELSMYIDSHLDGEISLSALAEKCFYNPSYFSRAFKKQFGISLTDYVAKKKMDQAVVLAENPSLSVQAIAEQVGFSSKSNFYRCFLKVRGISFSEFRKQISKK